VLIGITIQLGVFVAGASMVYIFAFQIVNRMISAYGYPFYLIGSMLLFCGLPGCSPVIQNSSRVESFYLKNRAIRCRPLCVQKAGSMDDKHFLSYNIFRPEGQSSITVSRSSEKEYSFVTLCSTVVVLTGLVCQSVGLRAMHWSVGLMQLAATLTIQMFRC